MKTNNSTPTAEEEETIPVTPKIQKKMNKVAKTIDEMPKVEEQCFCQSYYDENNNLKDCSCGKCDTAEENMLGIGLVGAGCGDYTSLTRKNLSVLNFIKSFIKSNKFSPSLTHIKDFLGIKSLSVAHYHISILEKYGFIERKKNRPNGISVKTMKKKKVRKLINECRSEERKKYEQEKKNLRKEVIEEIEEKLEKKKVPNITGSILDPYERCIMDTLKLLQSMK